MQSKTLDAAVERLMIDEDLVTLCELQRNGDEIFDVISLIENQHSDILGWLLDPREGHGQGDQILRDLLIATSAKALNGDSGLDGGGTTARFFKQWPPSRIRTASFGSAFYARELGMKPADRVDLFVIDPANKFILLIENKAGSRHTTQQLDRYRASFNETVDANPHLQGYAHVYIALDRVFDSDAVDPRPCEDSWIHMGYDWLKTSADRALLQVARGSVAAKLVVSYCNRQSDWESPEAKRCIALASTLHWKHPAAVKTLLEASTRRMEKDWLHTKKPANSLLFMLQNKGVIQLLRDTQGMASVKHELHAKLPNIPLSSIEHSRTWMNLCPSGWEQPEGVWWPLYINVRFSDTAKTTFRLRLVWNAEGASDLAVAKALRQRLAEVEPGFGTFGERQYRRVLISTGLSLSELWKEIEEQNLRLQAVSPKSRA